MLLWPLLVASLDSASIALPVSRAETLHVAVAGSGAPVVLIPGLFGSAYGFRKLVPLLTGAGYRTITIEPLGIGASGRPERSDYSLTAQADRIAAALDTLGVTHAIIVAHSLGASMAFRLAYRHPDLVRGIVSLEGGPAEAAATPSFRRAMRFVPWIKWFGGVRRIRSKIRSSLVAASGDTGWVTDSVVDAYTAGAAADLNGTLKAFVQMADAREPEPLAPHLGTIHCPVRLLVGTAPHAGGVPAADEDELRSSLPSFSIDSVPGSGHYIHEEQPQAVAATVRRLDSASLQEKSQAAVGITGRPLTAGGIADEVPANRYRSILFRGSAYVDLLTIATSNHRHVSSNALCSPRGLQRELVHSTTERRRGGSGACGADAARDFKPELWSLRANNLQKTDSSTARDRTSRLWRGRLG